MAGSSKKSRRPSLAPENLLMFVEQLGLRADAFHRTLQGSGESERSSTSNAPSGQEGATSDE
jgi:hypothetical protein